MDIEKIILNFKYISFIYFITIKFLTMRLHMENENLNHVIEFATIFYVFPLLVELIMFNPDNIGMTLLYFYIIINTANEYFNNNLSIKEFYSIIDVLFYYIIMKIIYYIYNKEYLKAAFIVPTFLYFIYLRNLKNKLNNYNHLN